MAITLVQTVTLGSDATSITFSSIPQTATDLMVKISARSSFGVAVSDLYIYFNGSTSGYTSRWLQGNGASASSSNSSAPADALVPTPSATSSTFNNTDVYVPNYAGATNKSYSVDNVTENNGSTAYQRIIASLWSNTAAITSLTVFEANGGNMVAGSTATLYTVTKGSSGGVTVS